MNNIICFHNPDEVNGYLSNWYLSDFIYNCVKYTSMEQYMMHQKALLFNDIITASKIINTNDVSKIKSLGREVSSFSDAIWDKYKVEIITRGLCTKFTSNANLLHMLLSTGDAILAECAVKDTVWGIGLSMKDPNRFDISKWRGQNLLGYSLMQVRDIIKSR